MNRGKRYGNAELVLNHISSLLLGVMFFRWKIRTLRRMGWVWDIERKEKQKAFGVYSGMHHCVFDCSTKNPGIFTIVKFCSGLNISIKDFFDSSEFDNIEYEIE